MKINLNILTAGLLMATAVSFSSCDDFLTRDPMDEITDNASFWNNEDNIRIAVLDHYTHFFPGYRSGWSLPAKAPTGTLNMCVPSTRR